jgi:PhnB protein
MKGTHAMPITPYLFFEGRAEEAMDFYVKALGATVTMRMRFSESPEPAMVPPGNENRIMHAELRIAGEPLMVSDGGCAGTTRFGGFSVSLPAADPAQAQRFFDALAEGGTVQMPLGPTFWSPAFGAVQDRFGVSWMIGVQTETA